MRADALAPALPSTSLRHQGTPPSLADCLGCLSSLVERPTLLRALSPLPALLAQNSLAVCRAACPCASQPSWFVCEAFLASLRGLFAVVSQQHSFPNGSTDASSISLPLWPSPSPGSSPSGFPNFPCFRFSSDLLARGPPNDLPAELVPTCRRSVADTLPIEELELQISCLFLQQPSAGQLPVTEADPEISRATVDADGQMHRGTSLFGVAATGRHDRVADALSPAAEPEGFSGSVPGFLPWNHHVQHRHPSHSGCLLELC
ncbi:hypothetical protein QBC47DRAFT_171365 [Echria macrotheca]|uniref:Uncharacterized protein n=1 Tax=Echria macrotheca TaxID=438768 RepID=A0AAJ0F7I2_9PEZI|nr:hypothetical protein QBC47DRAFT_171365 [Echria macrotheca]